MLKKKENRSAEFKCKIELESLKEKQPLNEIAKEYEVLPLPVGNRG